ncbi:MAG TPA: FRG domain-containing protein, partial [Rhizomicrobium sp.]
MALSEIRKHAASAESLVELFQKVYSIGRSWQNRWSPKPMRLWFRGVDDAAAALDPSLLRPPFNEGDVARTEYEIGLDFRIRGRPYLNSEPRSTWEELFMMQHYGFPTRLLDWTESMSAGAYFAARSIDSRSDGAVWVLSPLWLVHKAHGHHATHI